MSLLDNLGSLLGQGLNQLGQNQSQPGQQAGGGQPTDILGQILGGLGGLANSNTGNVLAPTALGGLAGALLGGKAFNGALGGALLMGGMQLWNQYKQRLQEENGKNASTPSYDAVASPPNERAHRIIRALVYAAKSDGHIDEQEQRAINSQIQQMNLGSASAKLVQEAMDESLDPATIAKGVKTPEEALEIFAISCAVLNVDNFMERTYLDGLAAALNIPEDVKKDIFAKMKVPA